MSKGRITTVPQAGLTRISDRFAASEASPLGGAPLQLSLELFPGRAIVAIGLEAREAMVKLGFLW